MMNFGNILMECVQTEIPEILIIKPRVFGDDRGFFFESFNKRQLERAAGRSINFVQENHSRSVKNVLRGLHYQIEQPQAKLVRVIIGEVYDVAVDIRRSSKTFGQWVGVRLSADNKHQLWIPEGFAHGFAVLSEVAEFLYLTSDYYAPDYERGIKWDDPDLNIDWPLAGEPLLSPKDIKANWFKDADTFM